MQVNERIAIRNAAPGIEERVTALKLAREAMGASLAGDDLDVADSLAVADWLLTGEIRVALQITEQNRQLYASPTRPSPDAASWNAVTANE